MSTRYNNGSHYENHQRAAELHDLAAQAHRVAEQQGKQDHLTGHEHSRRALEHSEKAHQQTQLVTPAQGVGESTAVENLEKNEERKPINSSTKDKIEGTLHELKGTAKKKVGQVTNNPNLEAEGQSEKLAGKVQKKVGQIEKVFEK